MAVPTLVQHFCTQSNQTVEFENSFKFGWPNVTLPNNLLLIVLAYHYNASRVVTITDDAGNSWQASPVVKADDVGNAMTLALFYVPGALASQLLTIVFDTNDNAAGVEGVQIQGFEFYNVATVSPVDGTPVGNTGVSSPTISASSITTTVDGDLIFQSGQDCNQTTDHTGGTWTSLAPGSGFGLISADLNYGLANQYEVQGTHGAITPSFTASGANGSSFNTVAIAFKAAAAGTAPNPTAMRVVGVYHTSINGVSGTANHKIQFVNTGNLLVCATAYSLKINLISDTLNGGYWTRVTAPGDDGVNYPQCVYRPHAISGNMFATLNLTDNGSGQIQLVMYDIVNADYNPFDVAATATGTVSGNADIPDAPDITPTTSNGVVIAIQAMRTGPTSGLAAPTGVLVDNAYAIGMTDLSTFDSADGYAHYYNPNTSALGFTWHTANGSVTDGWFAEAAAFKAANPISIAWTTA